MTYYMSLKIGSGEIGGAIAEAILHDIRVNGLGIQGFPQIVVFRPEEKGRFDIALQWGELKTEFSLTDVEAVTAVKQMKDKKGFSKQIFNRVQKAVATLESINRGRA